MNTSPTVKLSEAGLSRRTFQNQITEQALAPLPRLAFTMRETAEIIGVDYQTVYRLCKRGLLRSAGGLRTKLFPRAEIERFLKV
jgi:hypothetical protein